MNTLAKAPAFCEPCATVVTVQVNGGGTAPCPLCGTLLDVPDGCDVFISYATPDLEVARRIAAALTEAGFRHWIAPERLGQGDDFAEQIPPALLQAKVAVLVLSYASVQSPWVRREVSVAVSRNCAVLPLRIEEFDVPQSWRFMLNHNQWADAFRQPFDVSVNELVTRVERKLLESVAASARKAPAPVVVPVEAPALKGVNPAVSPYAGPRPFTAHMADRFYGRAHEAKALLDLFERSRVVLLYAPSGAGKTSLLNTLVCESLELDGLEVRLDVRVGGALPETIKAAEIVNIYSFSAIYGLDDSTVPNPRRRLAEHLRASPRKAGTRGRVLVFDQFEELFTRHVERFEDRVGFIDDLINALNQDPSLRVFLAMRQEYLADMDPLAALLSRHHEMHRFALRRLEAPGALEAITRPASRYASFAPGVAEAIVKQLNTIKVRGFDGVLVEKQGEFIEMVHLQIVCERLWASLPPGISQIEMGHVDRAAGEGKSFDEFVVNALDAFYDDTIDNVSRSQTTKDHGGFPKELLRLGCMKFVTSATTRTMVQQRRGRTGRLPDWIIEQLENSHLLRAEVRGGERWYELAHDRLAEPVGRRMDRSVSSLLYAADLLEKVLEKALQENGGRLTGHFVEHRDMLVECQPFRGQSGLFPDEAELLFRSSIASDYEVREWSERMRADFPDMHRQVVDEALHASSASVRRNAVRLFGDVPSAADASTLIELALTDPDDSVRQAAAVAVVTQDAPAVYTAILERLHDDVSRDSALAALARMRATADQRVQAPRFDSAFSRLQPQYRRKARRFSQRLRLREGLPALPLILLPTALFAAISAGAFKWLPGMHNLAIVQANASAGMGLFHGLTAGVVWAGTIVLGITLYDIVYANEFAPRSYWRPMGAIFAALLGAVVSSLLVVLMVVSVYQLESLSKMGWLGAEGSRVRFSLPFWRDLFVTTRFGWVHLVTGAGLGVGMAVMTNGMRASPRWRAFLARQTNIVDVAQTKQLVREIARIAARHVWPLPLALALAATLAFFVPDPSETANSEKNTPHAIALGIAGDCATQAIGAFFGIVGMGLGIVLVRCGVYFAPRRH